MAAAERGVWTATQLRRLLAEEADYPLSAPSVSALLTGEPTQVRLATLQALCTALRCTPDDLFDVTATPAAADPARNPAADPAPAGGTETPARGRTASARPARSRPAPRVPVRA